MRTFLPLAIGLATLSVACGSEEPDRFCRVDVPTSAAPTYDVQIGLRSGGAFVPFTEGDQAGVVTGGQGAVMIVPRVRIPDAPPDATERCMRIRLDNEFDYGLGPFSSLVVDETFRVIDGGWESVSIEVPLDYGDVDMRMITFTMSVRDETTAAEGSVVLELLNPT